MRESDGFGPKIHLITGLYRNDTGSGMVSARVIASRHSRLQVRTAPQARDLGCSRCVHAPIERFGTFGPKYTTGIVGSYDRSIEPDDDMLPCSLKDRLAFSCLRSGAFGTDRDDACPYRYLATAALRGDAPTRRPSNSSLEPVRGPSMSGRRVLLPLAGQPP